MEIQAAPDDTIVDHENAKTVESVRMKKLFRLNFRIWCERKTSPATKNDRLNNQSQDLPKTFSIQARSPLTRGTWIAIFGDRYLRSNT
jgi:hypothetical protein